MYNNMRILKKIFYSREETASGYAYTSTGKMVTSSATATALSRLSQDDVNKIAKDNAKKIANSVAQNNANIIDMATNISEQLQSDKLNYLKLNTSFANIFTNHVKLSYNSGKWLITRTDLSSDNVFKSTPLYSLKTLIFNKSSTMPQTILGGENNQFMFPFGYWGNNLSSIIDLSLPSIPYTVPNNELIVYGGTNSTIKYNLNVIYNYSYLTEPTNYITTTTPYPPLFILNNTIPLVDIYADTELINNSTSYKNNANIMITEQSSMKDTFFNINNDYTESDTTVKTFNYYIAGPNIIMPVTYVNPTNTNLTITPIYIGPSNIGDVLFIIIPDNNTKNITINNINPLINFSINRTENYYDFITNNTISYNTTTSPPTNNIIQMSLIITDIYDNIFYRYYNLTILNVSVSGSFAGTYGPYINNKGYNISINNFYDKLPYSGNSIMDQDFSYIIGENNIIVCLTGILLRKLKTQFSRATTNRCALTYYSIQPDPSFIPYSSQISDISIISSLSSVMNDLLKLFALNSWNLTVGQGLVLFNKIAATLNIISEIILSLSNPSYYGSSSQTGNTSELLSNTSNMYELAIAISNYSTSIKNIINYLELITNIPSYLTKNNQILLYNSYISQLLGSLPMYKVSMINLENEIRKVYLNCSYLINNYATLSGEHYVIPDVYGSISLTDYAGTLTVVIDSSDYYGSNKLINIDTILSPFTIKVGDTIQFNAIVSSTQFSSISIMATCILEQDYSQPNNQSGTGFYRISNKLQSNDTQYMFSVATRINFTKVSLA